MVFIIGIVIAIIIIYIAYLLRCMYLWINQPIIIILLSGPPESRYLPSSYEKFLGISISPTYSADEIYQYYFSKHGYEHINASNLIAEAISTQISKYNSKRDDQILAKCVVSSFMCKQIHFYSNICIHFLRKLLFWRKNRYRRFVVTDYKYAEQKEHICNFFPNAICISIWISPYFRKNILKSNDEVGVDDCDYVINYRNNSCKESLINKLDQIMNSSLNE